MKKMKSFLKLMMILWVKNNAMKLWLKYIINNIKLKNLNNNLKRHNKSQIKMKLKLK